MMNIPGGLLVLFVLAVQCVAIEPAGRDSDAPGEESRKIAISPVPAHDGKEDSPEAVLLTRAQESSATLYSELQSFVCNEQMERFKGAASGTGNRQIDTLRTKVSFENGTEQYDDIYQNNRKRPSISSVSGAWSEGEFGTLLRQTEALLNSRPVAFRAYLDLEGVAAALYEVEVSEDDSPWDLEIEQHHFRVPFRTQMWVSRGTGEILKLERVSAALSQVGIAEIRWGVALSDVELNGRTWLLPKSGAYSVTYQRTKRREWNIMTFADYRRYGSEAELRF